MGLRKFALAAAVLSASVSAQEGMRCDGGTGGTGMCFWTLFDAAWGQQYGFAFPPAGDPTYQNEFIGQWTIPIAGKWAGIDLGQGMNGNLLIQAWPNAGTIIKSPRQSLNYLQPTVYTGPTITTLATTINSTHWKWTFRCQSCTTWNINGNAGSFDPQGFCVFGWAYGETAPTNPAQANSNTIQHTDARIFPFQCSSGVTSSYGSYITGPVSTSARTTTTSRATSTSTRASTSSAGPTVSATPWDYVVVGAGNTGLVVADRLSEAGKKVLLIERGGPSTYNTGGREIAPWLTGSQLTRFDTPGQFESFFGSTNPYWWCNDVSVFAGCLIGGGAAINGALYWFAPDIDFATASGWPTGWQDVSAYNYKLKNRLPSTDIPSPDGKLYYNQVYDVISSVLNKQGYQAITINDNPNFKDHSYGRPAYSVKGGKRHSVMGTSYVTFMSRPTSKLWTWTYVTGLVRSGGRVTGVRTNYTAYGGNGIVPLTAKGRVILSAGAFGTARILFQSGIGPTDMINVVKAHAEFGPNLPAQADWLNLPVGLNVQDNPSINLVFTHPSVDNFDNWQTVWSGPRTADGNQYKNSQTGIFAGTSPRINWWAALGGSDGKTRYVQGTARPGGWPTTTYAYNSSQVLTVTLYLSTGITSRGRIGIDATLYTKVITNPWFQDPVDKAVMLSAISQFMATVPQVAGLTLITPDKDTTMTDFVNNYTPANMNSNHWCASTRIGTSKTTSVVDTNTKVWDVANLFIVDAGIVPSQPMGNPHAMFQAVAEAAVPKILALSGGA